MKLYNNNNLTWFKGGLPISYMPLSEVWNFMDSTFYVFINHAIKMTWTKFYAYCFFNHSISKSRLTKAWWTAGLSISRNPSRPYFHNCIKSKNKNWNRTILPNTERWKIGSTKKNHVNLMNKKIWVCTYCDNV